MDPTLQLQQRIISVEFDTTGFGHMAEKGVTMLHNYLNGMKEFMHELVSPMRDNGPMLGFVQNKDAGKLIERTNFVSLEPIEVYVPTGMTATFLEYLEALELSQHVADVLIPQSIDPAIAYFTQLVASPETMTSVSRQTEENKIISQKKPMASAKKAIQACYGKDISKVRRPYGDVFKRNADWDICMKKMESISTRIAITSPAAVTAKVDTLVAMIDRLIIRMQQSPEIYKVNGITGTAMARVTMELGEEVEFYAAHCHMVQVAEQTLKDNALRLHEILTDDAKYK